MNDKNRNIIVYTLTIIIVTAIASGATWFITTKSSLPIQPAAGTQPSFQPQQLEPDPALLEATQRPLTEQSIPTAIASDKIFDIANADKIYSPCDDKFYQADRTTGKMVRNFFYALKSNELEAAINLMPISKEENLLSHLFPYCSGMHAPLAYTVGHGGITMLIKSGNGYPSVPNDSYSFGHIWVSGNKILLRESNIAHYFDGSLGLEYEKIMSGDNRDFEAAVKILKQLEVDTKKGVETGLFANPALQTEYNEFVLSLR